MERSNVRNFCIIAHIDHGKSTLADRFLEITETISKRDMKEQVLDQMDLERERGITIKLQPVRMEYEGYVLNLIDTPGHVDFSYEVSRSLAAVEGALLLVDATQGIEAQTLANLYLALEQDLVIIPVINKIDLPNADVNQVRKDIVKLLGCQAEEVFLVSAKSGQGVVQLLKHIIKAVPAPHGSKQDAVQALIFDSFFDEYRGVIAYCRVMSGLLRAGNHITFMLNGKVSECLEVGTFQPELVPRDVLSAGDVGYVVTGLKEVRHCRVGDTITTSENASTRPLPGYKILKPMVFAGVYCREGNDYPHLRDALEKMSLNDSSFTYDPDQSEALGFGFRCGFLGILHLEIFQERLIREYDVSIIVTAPSVGYRVLLSEAGLHAQQRKEKLAGRQELVITSPLNLPEVTHIEKIEEPWMQVSIISPKQYMGNIMGLVQERRGIFLGTEYLDENRVVLQSELPLASILLDFYDKLKSVTSGYASLNYEFKEYRPCDVIRLDILVAQEPVEALATIVYRDEAYSVGRKVVDSLKDVLPRQLFEVKVQAAVGGKVVAATRIPALRKDVTAKLYGGDVTRKRKLLEKQKKGKRRMRQRGSVEIPQEAFLAVLKR
ncbi:MAG: translation elongation factor 4 [Patescibacteria group bacterium]